MAYGRNENDNLEDLKRQLAQQMPGVDIDSLSPETVKSMLVNEINKNSSIDPSVKEKISNGDVEGLRQDLINYLDSNGKGDPLSQNLSRALKNNDMESLKNQLLGMLFGSMNNQKKNEVNPANPGNPGNIGNTGNPGSSSNPSQVSGNPGSQPFFGFDQGMLMNAIMDRVVSSYKNDNRVVLLNSIRPFVSEARQKGIEDCIKIVCIIAFFENFLNKAGR